MTAEIVQIVPATCSCPRTCVPGTNIGHWWVRDGTARRRRCVHCGDTKPFNVNGVP